jgi:hypothetical protein
MLPLGFVDKFGSEYLQISGAANTVGFQDIDGLMVDDR